MKHTLSINKKMLYEHISGSSGKNNESINSDFIKDIKQENTRLNQALNKNCDEKIVLEQNVFQYNILFIIL